MAVVEARRPVAMVRWVGLVREFFQAVWAELHKVIWPSREELIKATRMIVILSVALGLFIGWMDLLFNLVLVDGVARLTR
jgi:preprotein translocase SecE subunit